MAVTDDAISKIKAKIIAGKLKPGERLPREADLAADLGVSRSSLRESVRALSLVRILEVRHGDGTYVSSLEPAVLLESLSFLIDFHRDGSVMDLLAVRRILEPAAAALAAHRLAPDEIAAIRDVIAGDSLSTPVNDLVDHDLRFHALIAAGSGNPVLASILDSIAMPTTRARIWRGLTQEDAYQQTIAEHAAIVEALEMRDSQLTAARAIVHVAGVEAWLRRALLFTPAAADDGNDEPERAAIVGSGPIG